MASQQAVLVGHSIGGLLARLTVSDAGPALLPAALRLAAPESEIRQDKLQEKLRPYTNFRPSGTVGRAIFIVAPHCGTPFAQTCPARWAAKLVALPAALAVDVKELADLLANTSSAGTPSPIATANGISNLSDGDPFIQATICLPILATAPDPFDHRQRYTRSGVGRHQ